MDTTVRFSGPPEPATSSRKRQSSSHPTSLASDGFEDQHQGLSATGPIVVDPVPDDDQRAGGRFEGQGVTRGGPRSERSNASSGALACGGAREGEDACADHRACGVPLEERPQGVPDPKRRTGAVEEGDRSPRTQQCGQQRVAHPLGIGGSRRGGSIADGRRQTVGLGVGAGGAGTAARRGTPPPVASDRRRAEGTGHAEGRADLLGWDAADGMSADGQDLTARQRRWPCRRTTRRSPGRVPGS
jgi:hypothetical protein